jgi:hypothetical protein
VDIADAKYFTWYDRQVEHLIFEADPRYSGLVNLSKQSCNKKCRRKSAFYVSSHINLRCYDLKGWGVAKDFVTRVKSLNNGGSKGSKFVQNCVTSFLDDPSPESRLVRFDLEEGLLADPGKCRKKAQLSSKHSCKPEKKFKNIRALP